MSTKSNVLLFAGSRKQSAICVGLLELYMSVQLDLSSVNHKDVAIMAKCSVTTLYNWESGKTKAPRIDTLTRVAAVLGYSIQWTRNYD